HLLPHGGGVPAHPQRRDRAARAGGRRVPRPSPRLSQPANARATASFAISPARTLSPFARAGSALAAASQPRSAMRATYGRVTFVRACVDVAGTAPGMLATQ